MIEEKLKSDKNYDSYKINNNLTIMILQWASETTKKRFDIKKPEK